MWAHKRSQLGRVLRGFLPNWKWRELSGEHCQYLSLGFSSKRQKHCHADWYPKVVGSRLWWWDHIMWYDGGKKGTFLPAQRENTGSRHLNGWNTFAHFLPSVFHNQNSEQYRTLQQELFRSKDQDSFPWCILVELGIAKPITLKNVWQKIQKLLKG